LGVIFNTLSFDMDVLLDPDNYKLSCRLASRSGRVFWKDRSWNFRLREKIVFSVGGSGTFSNQTSLLAKRMCQIPY
jgi:hypothetical protein